MRPFNRLLPSILAVSLAFFAGCASKSAEDRVLEERARWTVIATDWTQSQDGTVLLNTRLSGPPNSALETLTIRVVLSDAAGREVDAVWHVFDLSEVPRGGPKDFTIRIDSAVPVEGLAVDPLPRPAPEERARIPELAGI